MSTPEGKQPIRRALISVYDKTGLEELARGLHEAGVALVGTGNTHRIIAGLGIPIVPIEEVTGFPECLDGRVKTLHPRVHAGILADRRLDDHRRQLEELGVEPFDAVITNLYPFRETLASGAGADDIVEKIDIGGPSMVRAAAKNHHSVAVVVNPARYGELLDAVRAGGYGLAERKRLAAEAFRHTAEYDIAVSGWFASDYAPADAEAAFPDFTASSYALANVLRYGENPHQKAALYTASDGAALAGGPGLATAEQLHGKEMSYNNYMDTDAARRAAFDHPEPCVAIIKHANPCGIAVAPDIAEAHRKAHECDPLSAFGGVIATNRPVSKEMAERVAGIFTEVVVAPDYEDGALEVLTKKKNIRVLRCAAPEDAGRRAEYRPISGGLLVQDADTYQAAGDDPATWTLAAGEALDEAGLAELAFAWRAVRAVKSNAILLAKDGASVGVGMGQVNRVDSARLAVQRAGEERASGAYAASDAFFPFPDGLEVLIEGGVRAVVQPGGSKNDPAVVEAAQKAGVTMYLTGTRHFFH